MFVFKKFKKLFRIKKEEPLPPVAPQQKKFNDMSKEELKEKSREFKKKITSECREIEKQLFKIDNQRKKAEEDLKREIKKGVKGDKFIKQTFAKQVLQTQNQKERFLNNKAKLQTLQYTLDNFFADIKHAQTMQHSAGIMKEINQCMNVKELQVAMVDMQKEMQKMGIIQDIMEDAMEAVNDEVQFDNEQDINSLIDTMERNMKQPQQNVNCNVNQNAIQNNIDAQHADLRN